MFQIILKAHLLFYYKTFFLFSSNLNLSLLYSNKYAILKYSLQMPAIIDFLTCNLLFCNDLNITWIPVSSSPDKKSLYTILKSWGFYPRSSAEFFQCDFPLENFSLLQFIFQEFSSCEIDSLHLITQRKRESEFSGFPMTFSYF